MLHEFSKRGNSGLKTSETVPIGPLRCFFTATSTSAPFTTAVARKSVDFSERRAGSSPPPRTARPRVVPFQVQHRAEGSGRLACTMLLNHAMTGEMESLGAGRRSRHRGRALPRTRRALRSRSPATPVREPHGHREVGRREQKLSAESTASPRFALRPDCPAEEVRRLTARKRSATFSIWSSRGDRSR
jgi:hypothetical protein